MPLLNHLCFVYRKPELRAYALSGTTPGMRGGCAAVGSRTERPNTMETVTLSGYICTARMPGEGSRTLTFTSGSNLSDDTSLLKAVSFISHFAGR